MIKVEPGKTLDLACGDGKRGDIGVDHLQWPGVDYIVNLGFEPLPFEDNSFERVFAWDFFEHLPKAVYIPPDFRAYYPHIQVFNEAWRVLKPDGIFDTFTPILEPAVNGRLFHVSVWNENQFEQFTDAGSDFRRNHMQMNGLKARFEIVHREPENFGIHIHMRAIK